MICLAGYFLYWRAHAYDRIINKAAQLYGVDGGLIRSVIHRESRFRPKMVGGVGEIGLMQVTRNAALEWAHANGIEDFSKSSLYNPKTNIYAGSWYLGRAIRRWSKKDNPLPYALAEYNAGRSNALRWAASDGGDADKFWDGITYPTTRRYVKDVLARYHGQR